MPPASQEIDTPRAVMCYGDDDSWHDGPGWYFWDADHPDEGSVGAYETAGQARAVAREAGYQRFTVVCPRVAQWVPR